ncbi:methyltransferase [Paenibacillus apiarius]|uniref:methyltransferase n=1 Tax=Paenibacillus apiarius TaxID=46240 RepID=UPI003B3AD03B
MSRSWERKVRRNSAQLNKQRKKQGKAMMSTSTVAYKEFKGRSYILPMVLIGFTVIYAFLGGAVTDMQSPTLYWVTVFCYLGLGIILFLRRPFLRVGQDELSTIKWNRIRTLPAQEITKIVTQPGYVVIEHSRKGSSWVFSRTMNRYDTNAMAERLRLFAQQHRIEFAEDAKATGSVK